MEEVLFDDMTELESVIDSSLPRLQVITIDFVNVYTAMNEYKMQNNG